MKTILSYTLLIFCLLLPLLGNAQLILVTGNIINEKTGAALDNVNILESLSGIGTITNMSGFFSLMLKPGKAEIVVTYDGYKDLSKKMVLHADTTLTLSLAPLLNHKAKPKDAEDQKTAGKMDNGRK